MLVTNTPKEWEFLSHLTKIVDASSYLAADYHNRPQIRVVNLTSSYQYQSVGYYVSLLAQARDHKALPSVLNIQDTVSTSLSKKISQELNTEIEQNLKDIPEKSFILNIYFGHSNNKKLAPLAKKLHNLFPLPLLKLEFEKKRKWHIKKLTPICITEVSQNDLDFVQKNAISYFSKKRFNNIHKKHALYDLAILVDPSEKNPPSNNKALEQFILAGENIGLHTELIEKHDFRSLAEYDALYIRTTTFVNHYTYKFSRSALQENLIVIDDPQSIVKCSNKVYLSELLNHHGILTPNSIFVSKYCPKLPNIKFPCILKQPDGAFSKGVVKVKNQKDLEKNLAHFFKMSDLVLIQEYIPTDFDWRIGIMDNKPIYACKYFMAKDHWQIYNWQSCTEIDKEGDFITLDVKDVPDEVIKTALKGCKLIGNGLYGVDVKTYENKQYIIEINDNPNIDYGIEDQKTGPALYNDIMAVFLQRIRKKHGSL